MKKLLVSAGVAGLLFAGAGSALAVEPAPTEGADNASPQACFGQARASYSRVGINGETLSQRKGDNSWMNADFRDACQP